MARVLIIDDEPDIRSLLRQLLTLAGHEVEEAADGALGLAAYRRQPADLVLCDLSMPPGRGGLEVLAELLRGGASRVSALSHFAAPPGTICGAEMGRRWRA